MNTWEKVLKIILQTSFWGCVKKATHFRLEYSILFYKRMWKASVQNVRWLPESRYFMQIIVWTYLLCSFLLLTQDLTKFSHWFMSTVLLELKICGFLMPCNKFIGPGPDFVPFINLVKRLETGFILHWLNEQHWLDATDIYTAAIYVTFHSRANASHICNKLYWNTSLWGIR